MNKDGVSKERKVDQTTERRLNMENAPQETGATGGGNARSKRIKGHAHDSRATGSDGMVELVSTDRSSRLVEAPAETDILGRFAAAME